MVGDRPDEHASMPAAHAHTRTRERFMKEPLYLPGWNPATTGFMDLDEDVAAKLRVDEPPRGELAG
jgi:hypothetical protein